MFAKAKHGHHNSMFIGEDENMILCRKNTIIKIWYNWDEDSVLLVKARRAINREKGDKGDAGCNGTDWIVPQKDFT